jgi:hypothetical protein
MADQKVRALVGLRFIAASCGCHVHEAELKLSPTNRGSCEANYLAPPYIANLARAMLAADVRFST